MLDLLGRAASVFIEETSEFLPLDALRAICA